MEHTFSDLRSSDELCDPVARAILARHGITENCSRMTGGSSILYGSRDLVLKIFPDDEADFCANEAGFLQLLADRLPLRTPKLFFQGEHMGFPYIVMERLEGVTLEKAWTSLETREREKAVTAAAEAVAALHSIPAEKAGFAAVSWRPFIAEQLSNLESNHARYHLDPDMIARISEFIGSGEPVELNGSPVICHTEIMREHLFVQPGSSGMRVTGILDFEPSMAAVPDYEMCSVGIFLTAGEPELFRRFAETLGYRGNSMDVMRMLLLHRYSNMKWFISRLPDKLRTASLEDMAAFWFEL